MKKIPTKQFELALKAVTAGLYYSANPDKKEAMQFLAIDDIKDLNNEEKIKYINLREFGKDLYHTYPKGTLIDSMIQGYIDSVFDFIKVEGEI